MFVQTPGTKGMLLSPSPLYLAIVPISRLENKRLREICNSLTSSKRVRIQDSDSHGCSNTQLPLGLFPTLPADFV